MINIIYLVREGGARPAESGDGLGSSMFTADDEELRLGITSEQLRLIDAIAGGLYSRLSTCYKNLNRVADISIIPIPHDV